MNGLLVALAISGLQAAPTSPSPFTIQSPLFGDGWGVNLGFYDLTEADLSRMRELGLTWVRRDLFWHEVETTRGQYRFDRYDKLMSQLSELKIRPVFILCYGNGLYQEGSPTTPEARKAFVAYVMASIAHFRGKGVIWELWNEPNNHHWSPKPSAADYVALAKDVTAAVNAKYPGETLAFPGVAGFDWPFLETCFRSGLLKQFDVVSVHPYRPMEPESVADDYARLRRLMARYEPGGFWKPIICSEWGYSAAKSVMTEDVQAKYFLRQYLTNLASGVPITIWYNWTNNGDDPNAVEHNFGLLRPDRTPKPAFAAAVRMAKALKGMRFGRRVVEPLARLEHLAFRAENTIAHVVWAPGRKSSLWRLSKAIHAGSKVVTVPGGTSGAPRIWTVPLESRYEDLLGSWTSSFAMPNDDLRMLPSRIGTALLNVPMPEAHLEIEDGTGLAHFVGASALLHPDRELAKLKNLAMRNEAPLRLRVTVTSPKLKNPVVHEVRVVHPNPLQVGISPAGPNSVTVTIRALAGGFRGDVILTSGGRAVTRSVNVPDGSSRQVTLESDALTTGKAMSVRLVDEQSRLDVARTPSTRFAPLGLIEPKEKPGPF